MMLPTATGRQVDTIGFEGAQNRKRRAKVKHPNPLLRFFDDQDRKRALVGRSRSHDTVPADRTNADASRCERQIRSHCGAPLLKLVTPAATSHANCIEKQCFAYLEPRRQ